jgi:hypothetical protein
MISVNFQNAYPSVNKKFLCNKIRSVDCEKQSLLEFKSSIQGSGNGKLYHYRRKECFFRMQFKRSKNVVHEILFNLQDDIYILKPSICTHGNEDNSE